MTWTRRQILMGVMAGVASGGLLSSARAARTQVTAATQATVYKSPTCGCCGAWIRYLEQAGFTVTTHDIDDVSPVKERYGVPANLESCHTAVIDGYIVEGHVPAADIKRLLKEKPQDVRGLAVPGMPSGSPGMETSGPADRYDVIAWKEDGTWMLYARY